MHLKAHKNMLLKTIALLALLGLYDESLAEVATRGCSIETLKHDGSISRCFDHGDNEIRVIDKGLAPVATNCMIRCKQGDGVTYRVCDTAGYWNGPVLKCVDIHDANRKIERRRRGFWWNRSTRRAEPVRCGKPSAPAHGDVTGSSYNSGDTIKYSCHTGYTMSGGNSERKCSRSGWSGDKPTCTLATCGRPGVPNRGYISRSSYHFTYGDVVTYSCNTGYTLTGGDSSRTCRYNYWSGSLPSCRVITCGGLSAPSHGSVSRSGYEYGDVASYSCFTGYRLTGGQPSRNCGSSGYWSGNKPSCTRISCGRPSAPAHGSVSGSRYQYGDVIRYSCYSGYTLTGGSTARKCAVSGNGGYWNGMKPSCVFSNTCRSNPCQHGATCVNGLNRYDCRCKHGWSGSNCELDVLQPVVSNCPSNETHYTSTPLVTLNWTEPSFRDPTHAPSSKPIRVSSNYLRNEATLPWGEFIIQYVATKPSNGLRSECLFAESIYPFPCKPLVAPDNGAVACNGWNGRFGEVCTVLCQETRDLSPGKDISRLYVCGASGKWSHKMNISACSEPYLGDVESDVERHYYGGNCDNQRVEIGEKYIEILKASDMSEMCTSWADSCVPEKAKVVCGTNKIRL
ncbi:Sushi, von Willebrand factor type A, EGF and pentraxin domain-containing protein 1 [Lamellibrachia satsuma]|nr:Sushi, von Willebrand factor type A, EGF and pentraxin domain-containing protein 1 [Lamellibrachia satsuma]